MMKGIRGGRMVRWAITLHKVKPLIDAVFPFEEARKAYYYLAKGEQLGKVVISLPHCFK
jgi:NADPH:quinone reductase-like Zn-dependent oxidoreductase